MSKKNVKQHYIAEGGPFYKSIAECYSAVSGDGLHKFRSAAWKSFCCKGLPSGSTTEFKGVPLRDLYKSSYSNVYSKEAHAEEILDGVFHECSDSVLVFVDGAYSPRLSKIGALHEGVIIAPLEEAFKRYAAFFRGHIKNLDNEEDPFVLLNGAFAGDGVFIYIPPDVSVDVPLHVLMTTKSDVTMTFPRVHLFAGRNSSVTLYTHTNNSASDSFASGVHDFVVDAGARVHHIMTSSKNASWQFESVRARVKKDGIFKSITVVDSGSCVRYDSEVILEEDNAAAYCSGGWLLEGNDGVYINNIVDHRAPSTVSRQLYKGVCNDASRSSFVGKVIVGSEAHDTDARQENKNILLGDDAIADIFPSMEIFADDVKASHGATVGALDDEEIFYLRSRGLSLSEARSLLVYGFNKEVLDFIPLDSLRRVLEDKARRFISS